MALRITRVTLIAASGVTVTLTSRPHLRARDRLFWIALAWVWRNWRTALT